jgi:SAM-dependent methyltransferase
MNQTAREQADRALFDRIAARYAKKDTVEPSSFARRSQLLSAMRPVLQELDDLGTVVDIGCGVGAPARYLAGRYRRYIGVDQSGEMIRAARTFNHGNPHAEFLIANVKSFKLPLSVADAVPRVAHGWHDQSGRVMDFVAWMAKRRAFLVSIEP